MSRKISRLHITAAICCVLFAIAPTGGFSTSNIAAYGPAAGAPGDPDTTFGQGGMATVPIPGSSSVESANAVALQSDGKAVVVGTADNNIGLMRLNTDGSLDTTFGFNGKVATTPGVGSAVALQTDGKIVVAGNSGGNFFVARYLTTGDLDTSFGDGGSTVGGFADFALAVAIQQDGKIVAAGRVQGSSETDFLVVRLNSDGSFDSTFGAGGRVTTDFPGPNGSFDAANAVTIQSDGDILVAGVTNSQSTGDTFAVARYLTNGGLDPAFGANGLVTFTLGNRLSAAYAIAQQSTGQIIVAGEVEGNDSGGITGGLMLGRLNSDGTLDASFGNFPSFPGIEEVEFTSSIQNNGRAMAIYPDDSILMAGSLQLSGQSLDYLAAAFQSNGGFINASRYSANLSSAYKEEGRALARVPGGSNIFIAGVTDQNDTGDVGVLLRDTQVHGLSFGQFPVAFAGNGNGVALQTDGKIVAGGTTSQPFPNGGVAVVRLNPNGTRDTSFGNGGFASATESAGFDSAFGVAVQADGKIVLAGTQLPVATENRFCKLFRFTSTGALDPTFGTGGIATFDTTGPGNQDVLFQVRVQSDGKILAVGQSNTSMLAVRVMPNGTPDAGFGTNGVKTIGVSGNTSASRIAIQSDGKIILAGKTDSPRSMVVARLNTDGSSDGSFGAGGIITPAAGFEADALALQSDGKIVLAGINSNSTSFTVMRCLTNGSLDPSFGSGGVFSFNGVNLGISDAAIQSDGRILLAGYNEPDFVVGQGGHGKFAVWRVMSNGTLDTGFGSSGMTMTTFPDHASQSGFYTDSITGIAIQPDGKIDAVGTVQASLRIFGFARYIGGTLGTTAARVNVCGRVLTPEGAGLRNARVVITDANGETRSAITGAFGYYRFDSVEAGKTYVISAVSHKYGYEPRVVDLTDAVDDLDFSPR